ncbi:uncharacterized protein LY79DRAFT_363266 [Colletotrichum navitas]|uniref:Uncharacterized protein n=1 Tax=Colletotrichum navitas TaxID=681940 RepID=A0AAD8PRY1_9PEZI|nr:uncharacterized protein LY79DRAFT_363266 [Colletotrichum navitas]KAK1574579.1 hypothetical protein LY79DRAFT_363266 [Colletotrichum navitas]
MSCCALQLVIRFHVAILLLQILLTRLGRAASLPVPLRPRTWAQEHPCLSSSPLFPLWARWARSEPIKIEITIRHRRRGED